MRIVICAAACALLLLSSAPASAQGAKPKRDADVERGRYLVKIAGCNDCHTEGYAPTGGAVPEKEWLMGSVLGFQGDWGTTYPANLRLVMSRMTEAQWMKGARQPLRPPMPWFALRDMTDSDLRAIYRYVKALGPAGQPAPAYVAPGGKVAPPLFVLVPPSAPPPTK
jgi:mono/diheme cytochrome c family protein